MRKLTAALCLGLAGAFALPAQATEVAVLDWQAALMETEAAQRSMAAFQDSVQEQRQEAEALGQELQAMQQRLQEEGELMSEADRRATVETFQQKGQRFEGLRREILQAQQQAEQAFLEDAEPKLDQAVERVIARHDVEVLVDPNGVVHAEGDLPNLTAEVTEILDSLY